MAEFESKLFPTQESWAAWLKENHRASAGLWLRLGKKGSELQSVTYAEALEVALCYGWIDGQKRPESDLAWLQKFSPRGQRSLWSKVNRERAQALIAAGEMQLPGLAAIETAKQNGCWDSAYDPPSTATVPDDFQLALDASPRAAAFFATVNRANRYALLWRIQTAKRAETRARRIAEFVGMLERGETFH